MTERNLNVDLAASMEAIRDFAEKTKKAENYILDDLIPAFFKNNPEAIAFAWTQYAPYFMDGEPCEFSVNEPYYFDEESFKVMHDSGEVPENLDEFKQLFGSPEEGETAGKAKQRNYTAYQCVDALMHIDESTMRNRYGEDHLVAITRWGLYNTQYTDHY